MLTKHQAAEIATSYLNSVVRYELGREQDEIIGNRYYIGEGWLFFHDVKDMLGGCPNMIAVAEKDGEIITFDSEHILAIRMQEIAEKGAHIRKHGYF